MEISSLFYFGRYTFLYFDSVNLGGGTEHENGTNPPLQTHGKKHHGQRIPPNTNQSPHKFIKTQLTYMISKNVNNI